MASFLTRSAQAARAIAAQLRAHRSALSTAAILLVAGLAFTALHRVLIDVPLREVRASLHAVSAWRIAAAMGLTGVSYLLLSLYDVLALRIIGRPQPYRTAALASFTSYTLSHNLGLGLLTGGSARYRIYSARGVPAGDILRVIAIASLTFWLGICAVTGALLFFGQVDFAIGGYSIPCNFQHWIGLAVLASVLLPALIVPRPKRPLRCLGWSIPLPGRGEALAQLTIAVLDLIAASGALFVLIPGGTTEVYPNFMLAYGLAIVAGLLSHVPGGVGVFEAVILAASPSVDKAQLLAALIAYRAVYYLLPLCLAAVMMAIYEHRHWGRPVALLISGSRAVAAGFVPTFMAAITFLGGAILLVSGALPGIPQRLQILKAIIPLPFAEASHIAASLSGTLLLLLAPGLYHRQDAAFLLARTVLIAGALFSLVKGIDYEEAILLLAIAGLLQWTRRAFYRHTALTRQSFSKSWLTAVGTAVGLSLWIGLFAYKHVSYQSELWWQFAWRGDAPRFLRAAFATAVLLVAAALSHLLRSGRPEKEVCRQELPATTQPLTTSDRTDAMLAWTGDKRFLVAPGGSAFLMYQVQGDSWIVMGDPVGPSSEWADLMWRIRDEADSARGRILFYQISTRALPFAIDMGLQLIKYGEEARIDLASFSLDRPEAKALRYAERRAMREGASFDIAPAAEVPSILPDLREISDAWLRSKHQSEKAFSVGRFDPAYISRFDCAVVRWEGKIIAFANIWATASKEEISVDLMRHADHVPYGTMDFLFVSLMVWAQQQGYRWFSLGLAPLSGIDARRLAPIWARIGHILYRHGEALYGFEGLRAYKEKFCPDWEPRYIAGPHGLALVRALVDLQTLVGGGRRSAARRASLSLVA